MKPREIGGLAANLIILTDKRREIISIRIQVGRVRKNMKNTKHNIIPNCNVIYITNIFVEWNVLQITSSRSTIQGRSLKWAKSFIAFS